MNRHEQRIVRFLSRPGSYPHPVRAVVRRETHVSHVFLAGEFAYKLKKSVRFPFLDASTLGRRKRFCQLELSLNRRLAPAVYLRIVPIVETREGLRLGGPQHSRVATLLERPPSRWPRNAGRSERPASPTPHALLRFAKQSEAWGVPRLGRGKAIEWVVQMRRLPEERMLDQLIAKRRVGDREMTQIADRLIPFFKRAARGRRIDHYGRSAQVAELLLGNLRECQPFVGDLLPEADRRLIEVAYKQFLTLQEPLLARRVLERRIIDGHGDLRCENICVTQPVNVFDCVEFQPAFRCGDAANDFSFLLMDLEFRGRQDLADVLVARYRRKMKDPTFERIVPVYKCHRSLVRGKVRGLAWRQHPRTTEGRRIRRLARRHFQLARRYAEAFSRPRLIVVGGVIGTGKSQLAEFLSGTFGAAWLRTDEIRLREFARFRRPNQRFQGGLYAPHVSQLVYQRLIRRAEELVRQGRSVVCDGIFSKVEGRQALRDIAKRHGASFHFFECIVPRRVSLRRVGRRYAAQTDLSEARPEHYDRLKAGVEPVNGWPTSAWTRLRTHRSPEATQRAALIVLRRAWTR